MENTENISFSQYDIYSKLLEVANRHIPTNDNTDFLRSGLFGYITESLAMGLRDSALQKTFLYNEGFLNTAVIPDSVYNYAKMFNVSLPTAIPSKGYVSIQIPESDFQQYKTTYNVGQYGLDTQYTNAIVISNTGEFMVGSYPFKLERSILIYENENGNILAEYITPTNRDLIITDFASQSVSNGDFYINNKQIVVTRYNGNIILNHVLAYQFEITEKSARITSNRIVDNLMQRVEYPNQFAGLSIKYTTSGRRTDEQIQNIIPIFSPIDPKIAEYDAISKKYCFYDLEADNFVKVKFRSNTFVPSINSSLTISVISTNGVNISTNISGNYSYRQTDIATNAVAITVSFENALSGGVNTPNIESLKARIINEISTRNIILTEEDINNYFALLSASWLGYDSKIVFSKKRDDILKRIFSAYCVLRSGVDAAGNDNTSTDFVSMAVPTNTINVVSNITGDNVRTNNGVVSQIFETGSKFTLDPSSNTYIYSPGDINGNDYYFTPFEIEAYLAPVRHVKYRFLMTDSQSPVYLNETGNVLPKFYNIIGESLTVYRGMTQNGTIDDKYRFTLKLSSNADLSNLQISNDGNIVLKLKDIKNNEITVTVDKNDINLTNAKQIENSNQYTAEIQFNVSKDINLSNLESAYVDLKMNNFIIPIDNVDNSYFTLIFKTENPIVFQTSLEAIMNSDVQLLTTTVATETKVSGINLLSVPVIHSSFLNNATNSSRIEKIVKQISMNIQMLMDGLEKLEANSQFDFKFFNTHGPSTYYNVSRTDFIINIDIALAYLISDAEKDLIRDYIRRIVDRANDDGFLNTSDIITMTLQNFNSKNKVIKNIYINSVNGEALAIIAPNYDAEKPEVPEYLTFPFDKEKINAAITFRVVS